MIRAFSILFMFFCFCSRSFAVCEFPCRTITNVVVWGASGATDSCNRILSRQMEQVLGVRIDVINMIGGKSGSWGIRHVMDQPRDGYTLCGFSEGCVAARALGESVPRVRDWHHFIAVTAPIVISVPAESRFETFGELLDVARNEAGRIRVATSGVGTAHHLNLLALEQAAGVTFDKVVFPGSSPAQEAALEGGAHAVISALPEQISLLEAGKLRPLAVFTESAPTDGILASVLPVADTVPSLVDSFSVILGFSVPADIPAEASFRLEEAFAAAIRAEEFRAWACKNHFRVLGISGEEAARVYEGMEQKFSETIRLND